MVLKKVRVPRRALGCHRHESASERYHQVFDPNFYITGRFYIAYYYDAEATKFVDSLRAMLLHKARSITNVLPRNLTPWTLTRIYPDFSTRVEMRCEKMLSQLASQTSPFSLTFQRTCTPFPETLALGLTPKNEVDAHQFKFMMSEVRHFGLKYKPAFGNLDPLSWISNERVDLLRVHASDVKLIPRFQETFASLDLKTLPSAQVMGLEIAGRPKGPLDHSHIKTRIQFPFCGPS